MYVYISYFIINTNIYIYTYMFFLFSLNKRTHRYYHLNLVLGQESLVWIAATCSLDGLRWHASQGLVPCCPPQSSERLLRPAPFLPGLCAVCNSREGCVRFAWAVQACYTRRGGTQARPGISLLRTLLWLHVFELGAWPRCRGLQHQSSPARSVSLQP